MPNSDKQEIAEIIKLYDYDMITLCQAVDAICNLQQSDWIRKVEIHFLDKQEIAEIIKRYDCNITTLCQAVDDIYNLIQED